MEQQNSQELIKQQANEDIKCLKNQTECLKKQIIGLKSQIELMQKKDNFKNLFLAGIGLEKLLDVYIKHEELMIRPDDYEINESPENLLGKGGSGFAFKAKIKVKGVWKNVCAKIIENDNLEELLKKIEVQMQEADIYLKTQSP